VMLGNRVMQRHAVKVMLAIGGLVLAAMTLNHMLETPFFHSPMP
jgi:hypothetical protein